MTSEREKLLEAVAEQIEYGVPQLWDIPWEQFRWYAAFHDESHRPHVHMYALGKLYLMEIKL